MSPMVWVWLGITVALLIFEICTTSLTSIWFAGGSLTAFVLSLFKLPLWVQIVAFVVVSVVLLIFTRPLVEKVLKFPNCNACIIAHNHPNGIALPSRDDIDATAELKQTLAAMGITLVDHIIVEQDDYVSMASSSGFKNIFR